MILTTRSEEETRLLGRQIGEAAFGGISIALCGGLGAGKTVLVRGLARGLGISERTPITSPTYTLINEYPGPLRFFHVDLYRIEDAFELEEIGFEEIFSEDSVVAVEWAQRFPEELPRDRLEIRIEETGETLRTLTLASGGQRSEDLLIALENRTRFQPRASK